MTTRLERRINLVGVLAILPVYCGLSSRERLP